MLGSWTGSEYQLRSLSTTVQWRHGCSEALTPQSPQVVSSSMSGFRGRSRCDQHKNLSSQNIMQHSRNVLKMNFSAAMATAYLNADSAMEHTIVLSMRREGVKTKRFEFQLLSALLINKDVFRTVLLRGVDQQKMRQRTWIIKRSHQ